MKEKRFVVVYEQGTLDVMRIILDTATGVQYLQTNNSGSGGGVTCLLDRDGKPLISRTDYLNE